MTDYLIVFAAVIALIVALSIRKRVRKVTIFEYERGLLYTNGAFKTLMTPGSRWIWTPSQLVTKVDVRPRITAVPGQEVLTSDGVAVKVSLVAQYRIAK